MDNIIEWTEIKIKDFFFENKNLAVSENYNNYVFSIVIAVYNSENYIEETLNSVIEQDFDFTKTQIVIVDDGSTDNSFEICKAYAMKYPHNIILVHKTNGGVSSARNVGMYFALGKYINFLDSDDKFGKNVCSEVFNFFEIYQNKTDVVTIKVEIFGDKTGKSWYNKKFEKGNRIINLFNEPTIYLNSTNNTFFHKRIKNQLHFDEDLSIAEDLKVVNTVLMNKYTLGVINSCIYYYRIRTNESLASTASKKAVWYLTYLEKVFYWLYNKSVKQTGRFLDFLQYTLLRELYNRINNNVDCINVLKDDGLLDIYKSTLFQTFNLIDDKIIKNCGFLNTDFMLYIFSIKYGRPSIVINDNDVHFVWKNKVDISKKLYANFELCSVNSKKLILEGYVVINNIQYDLSDCRLLISMGDYEQSVQFISDTNNDMLAFADEYIFYRKYFKISIPYPKVKSALKLSLLLNGLKIPYQFYGYDQWFGVDKKLNESYYYCKHFMLTINDNLLYIEEASKLSAMKQELALLKVLRKQGKSDETYKKAMQLRLYYDVRKLFCFRKIWIISDRCISAGDNGEAFYSYMKKKKTINSFFAINEDSPDFDRLKSQGYKMLALNSKKYKKKFLLADVIVSAHFDNSELRPITTTYLNDIKAKKIHVFLQHGITKDDVSHFYSRKRQKLDRFITAAKPEYSSIINNANYFSDSSVVKLTGFPRYDKLYSSKDKVILIMPTWRNNLVSFGNNSAGVQISKDFLKSYYFTFYHGLLSNQRLQDKAAQYGYIIYYFPHFNMVATNEYFNDIPGINIIDGKLRDYNLMFATASVMITDYSSTAFDFAYLRKPIIYCQGDNEDFFTTHTYTKGYFDYEVNGFGRVTKTVEETVDEIINILDKNCVVDDEYLQRINQFFQFNDRANSKRVYKAIKSGKKDE